MIDLSLAFAVSELEDVQRIARRAMNKVKSILFDYELPHGQLTLRQQVARLLIQQGLEITPDNLIITNGSKQGLSLALQYYVQPGDWVIVESPTYHGILQVLSHLKARVIGISMTAEGINLELPRTIPSYTPPKTHLYHEYFA